MFGRGKSDKKEEAKQKKLSKENGRIAKEFKMLRALNPEHFLSGKIEKDYGIIVPVEIQRAAIKSRFLSKDIQKLHFEILLTDKYPHQPPQVYCKSRFCQPTIDDKRDLIEEVLQSKQWNAQTTIYELIQLIPEFISDTLIQMKSDDEVKSIGKWHLGNKYSIDDWGVGFFKAREEKDTEGGVQYFDRYLAVCENSFFLFEPDTESKNMARLLSVATLCSLERIIRNLDMPDSATLVWRQIEHEPQWTLKVEISNADICINLMVNYLKKLGIKSSKKYEKKRKILASEVTKKAHQGTDIERLAGSIEQLEAKQKDGDLTKKDIQTMIDLYQKVIEYYSAVESDSEKYSKYLSSMTSLFGDVKIQEVLNQPDEPTEEVTTQETLEMKEEEETKQ